MPPDAAAGAGNLFQSGEREESRPDAKAAGLQAVRAAGGRGAEWRGAD